VPTRWRSGSDVPGDCHRSHGSDARRSFRRASSSVIWRDTRWLNEATDLLAWVLAALFIAGFTSAIRKT
jgi:hypothetical protein